MNWSPSLIPKYTTKKCFHKVYANEVTYALSIRGPWQDTWQEYLPNERKTINLTSGRKEVK